MLKSLNPEVADCYARARDAQERAETARDPAMREHYRGMERRWLLLAQSHEMRARLESFTSEARARLRAFTPRHPAIPRVMCPECGRHMRLERIEPSSTPQRRADVVTFTCACTFLLHQTIDRAD
jgi:hypothetical protein